MAQTEIPNWKADKEQIEKEKKEFHQLVEGENVVEIDLTKKSHQGRDGFGKDKTFITLVDGKVISINRFLFEDMLDKIIQASEKGQKSVKITIVRVGKTQSDTRYSVKE